MTLGTDEFFARRYDAKCAREDDFADAVEARAEEILDEIDDPDSDYCARFLRETRENDSEDSPGTRRKAAKDYAKEELQ